MTDFEEGFRRLWNSKNPEKRGLQFEELFCRLLFASGFVVHKNPDCAKPRQTDFLAEHGTDAFLFETKWLDRRVDVEAAGQINDRLRRTPKGTVGCICSASGFTENLIRDVEEHRAEFEVLLFNPEEIYGIFVDGNSVLDLIDIKRRTLRCDGVMWFFGQTPRQSKRRYVELPPSHESFYPTGASLQFSLKSEDRDDIIFARTPLLFDEYLSAYTLRIRLGSSSVDGLRQTLIAAQNYLGLRGTGTFGMRQQTSGWFGLGSGQFLTEVARHSQRYRDYRGPIHHSEELAFFDELRGGGLFLLTARQSSRRRDWIHSGEIIVRLPGIPVNTEPYRRFVGSLTQQSLLFTQEEPLKRCHVGLRRSIKIHPSAVRASIGSNEIKHPGGCISGVVVKNPFFKNASRISKFSDEEELCIFSAPEYLICSLDDWLDVGDEVNHYVMTSMETVRFGHAVLLHPRCTWGDLVKRANPGRGDGLRRLETELKKRDAMVERIKNASKRTSSLI